MNTKTEIKPSHPFFSPGSWQELAVKSFHDTLGSWRKDAAAMVSTDVNGQVIAGDNYHQSALDEVIRKIPETSLYGTKASILQVIGLRHSANQLSQKLVMNIAQRFWIYTSVRITKSEMIDAFMGHACSALYSEAYYKNISSQEDTSPEYLSYVGSIARYEEIERLVKAAANDHPEIVPLFYLSLFIYQILEE